MDKLSEQQTNEETNNLLQLEREISNDYQMLENFSAAKANLNEQPENAETKPANPSRRFNLKFGYQDKEDSEIIHREVVISRRPTAKDLLKIEDDLDSEDIQSSLEIAAATISTFGTLTMPVSMTVLLELNEVDSNKLSDEFSAFLKDSQPKKKAKILEDSRVQLANGIDRDGAKYDVVEFGNLLSGHDRIKISNEAKSAKQFKVLKIAREVTKLSTADGSKSISGTLTLAEIELLDMSDFIFLVGAESRWLNSFRD